MSVKNETELLNKENQVIPKANNTYETTTLTSTTTTTTTSTTIVHSAIVKSTDGKFHQLNFDIKQKTLKFVLLKFEILTIFIQ